MQITLNFSYSEYSGKPTDPNAVNFVRTDMSVPYGLRPLADKLAANLENVAVETIKQFKENN